MTIKIADVRKEYATKSLLESDVNENPIIQFDIWLQEAFQSKVEEPNAMIVATASCDGLPTARVMLLKGVDEDGFVFFTNYNSYKAMQLEENPRACLVFFWKELERQVRIVGLVKKISNTESDAYFLSRPEGSRIGAWASPQSQVIESRKWMDEQYLKHAEQFREQEMSRPPHWGGYKVNPVIMEFWQGRPSRLHDRIQYTLEENGSWKIERLAP